MEKFEIGDVVCIISELLSKSTIGMTVMKVKEDSVKVAFVTGTGDLKAIDLPSEILVKLSSKEELLKDNKNKGNSQTGVSYS